MLLTLAISGYRSIRDLRIPLDRLTLITGANGSGKSNLYKATKLLAEVAQGRVVQTIAKEGGLDSLLWAGPEKIGRAVKQGLYAVEGTQRQDVIGLKLGFSSQDYGYAIDMGLPIPGRTMFSRDPEIKSESVWIGEQLSHRAELARRRGPGVSLRDPDTGRMGDDQVVITDLPAYHTMMTQAAHPRASWELLQLRAIMQNWRFYDALRTDPEAPARRTQIGTRSPILSGDGANLAAAVQTIFEIGEWEAFCDAIDLAFPGMKLGVVETNGLFELQVAQHGLLRPLSPAELSDGTLRYILLATALFSPRLPQFLVLNEPETSLNPSLLPALGEMIKAAAQHAQIMVVSHASKLINSLEGEPDCLAHHLYKEFGETLCDLDQRPKWTWPKR